MIDVEGPLQRDPGSRSFYATSSCGVCGKGAIDQVRVDAPRATPGPTVARGLLASLPERLPQPAFELTGGLHATGLFDHSGELLCAREDVGRHNAMDKVIGWALGEGLVPLGDSLLCVSGRLSFELVQKAAVAGAPILVGVGAPSSLAIALADELGMTLCGFARGGSVNVYAGRSGSAEVPARSSGPVALMLEARVSLSLFCLESTPAEGVRSRQLDQVRPVPLRSSEGGSAEPPTSG